MAYTGNQDRSAVGTIEVNPGTGFVELGKIVEEEIRINGELIKSWDVASYPFGVDETIRGNVEIEIDFTWREISDIALWNMIIHGGAVTTTTADTQAVTDEEMTLDGRYDSNEWNALAYAADFDIDCTVVVGSAALGGGSTWAEGTDYIISRKTGELGRIHGAGIDDGDTVYVDYVYDTYAGKYFEMMADETPAEYVFRFIKPLLNGDNKRIQHGKVIFGSEMGLSLSPGDGEGAWVGVPSKVIFLKDTGGTYGNYGRWEIYTP